jgi:nucleotide sugar dehydrogenase
LSDGNPDLSRVVASGRALSKILKTGALVVLESTTYPGTTEDLLRPLLEAEGLQAGRDFFLAYSPERIDPGNRIYGFGDVPKVVGGIGRESTELAVALYQQVVPKVVAVSGTKEAELTKLIENTFRHVNIALVNELAVYAHDMGVDIWEAIEAAATKPFGYLPFWPGPGWGGHCIPLDPSYLSWRVRQDQAHEVRFVELAHAVNAEMPRYVVERVSVLLNERGKPLQGARILGVGIAYKGGTEDTRESPALRVLHKLKARGAQVSYHDPLVPAISSAEGQLTSVHLDPALIQEQDLVLVLIAQRGVDWHVLARESPILLDCCNAMGIRNERVIRL